MKIPFLTADDALEAKLAEASSALLQNFRALHARRSALCKEAAEIAAAPLARPDLAAWLAGVVAKFVAMRQDRFREELQRVYKAAPGDHAYVAKHFHDCLMNDKPDWFINPLLAAALQAGAARLAETVDWPDPGLPLIERAAKVRELEGQAEAIQAEIDSLVAKAARLNITLTFG